MFIFKFKKLEEPPDRYEWTRPASVSPFSTSPHWMPLIVPSYFCAFWLSANARYDFLRWKALTTNFYFAKFKWTSTLLGYRRELHRWVLVYLVQPWREATRVPADLWLQRVKRRLRCTVAYRSAFAKVSCARRSRVSRCVSIDVHRVGLLVKVNFN